MATAKTIQQQLAEGIQLVYTNSIVKKIDEDNFLDIHIPEVNHKKGTHLFFNTNKEGIKIGFYCRDEDFVNNAASHSQKIEKYSQGLRILDNPLFVDVVSANSAALSFISDIIVENNPSLNSIDSKTINISSENQYFVERLESFDSETMVMVQMFSQYGIRELGNGGGTWNGNYYTFDYTTDWNEGYLENSEAISVENLIELLKSKKLEEIDQNDFDALYLGTIRNGNTTYDNFEWENGVSKKEIKVAPSEEELCEEGDKLESEYFWSSPERIEFVVTEEDKEDLNYVLSSKESEDNKEDEDEEISNLFNFSEFDLDDYYLIKKAAYRIEHEKALTGLVYIPESLVEVGFEKLQNPFFFVSYVNISEDELNGFLYVNAEGFYSNCYTNNEIQFIFSWDGLIDIKIIEDEENSIKIELISNDGSLIISEPFSTNLKVLLSIYNTLWKDVILKFASESEYDWNIIENELGVTIYSFDSLDEYENWINEQVLEDEMSHVGIYTYDVLDYSIIELNKEINKRMLSDETLIEIIAYNKSLTEFDEDYTLIINNQEVWLTVSRSYEDSYWKIRMDKLELSNLFSSIQSHGFQKGFETLFGWNFFAPGDRDNNFKIALKDCDEDLLPKDCFVGGQVNPYTIFDNYEFKLEDTDITIRGETDRLDFIIKEEYIGSISRGNYPSK